MQYTFRYCVQSLPWPIQASGIGFAVFGWLIVMVSTMLAKHIDSIVLVVVVLRLVVWYIVRCRRVIFERDVLVVGQRRLPWASLEVPHFRDSPLARAGMFVRFTDEARAALGLPPPKYRDYGFGLGPAPNRELGDKRYDLFL